MWSYTSVEFPSDNQDLWRAEPPAFAVEILSPPLPLVEAADAAVPSVSMEELVLESLTATPPSAVAVAEAPAVEEEPIEVEVVDDFEADAFEGAIDDSSPPPPAEIPAPLESMVVSKLDAQVDGSVLYLQTLKDVAVSFGATAVFAETLDSVLGREPMCVDDETGDELVAKSLATKCERGYEPDTGIVRVAAAWQAAFRGEEPDFSVCTSMLDEWSADLVAKLLGRKDLLESIRRELRGRGIAAFGLLDAA